jgi:hypothetical protein
VVDQSKVVRMTQMSETFVKRWSGKVTLGSSYARGNNTTSTTLVLGSTTSRPDGAQGLT